MAKLKENSTILKSTGEEIIATEESVDEKLQDYAKNKNIPTKLSQLTKDINFDERYYTETEINTKLAGKVDNSRVLTDVPANAKFTDTITTINGKTGAISKSDITALGIPAQDTTYDIATTNTNGLMSSTDKAKLNGIEAGANKTIINNTLTSTSTTQALSASQGKALKDDLDAHKAENASQHGDLTTLKTSQKSSLVEAINELFTNVSDGKSLIATAITDMGQSASGSDTFTKLANSIRAIKTGDYSIGDILDPSKYLIAPKEVWKFTGHTGWVRAVAVDSSGNVYSGSADYTVRKINSSGNEIWKFTGHTDYVRAIAVDNNGNVYSGSDDKTIRKISPSGSQLWSFTGHTDWVNDVAVDNNGNVYSASRDKTARKISPSGSQLWSFTGHTSFVNAVAVDNNGNVYSGSRDKTVIKINPSGNEIWKFTGHTDYVQAVAVDNNGNVYSGSYDNTVRKISPSGNEVWQFTGHTNSVNSIAVDNNGNVYSGSADKTVRKISSSGTEIWKFTGHTDYVSAVAVDSNGNVYSGSDDRTLRKIVNGIKIIG